MGEDIIKPFINAPLAIGMELASSHPGPREHLIRIQKARVARGGPGGHMARKAAGKPIIPEDLEKVADEINGRD